MATPLRLDKPLPGTQSEKKAQGYVRKVTIMATMLPDGGGGVLIDTAKSMVSNFSGCRLHWYGGIMVLLPEVIRILLTNSPPWAVNLCPHYHKCITYTLAAIHILGR